MSVSEIYLVLFLFYITGSLVYFIHYLFEDIAAPYSEALSILILWPLFATFILFKTSIKLIKEIING